MAAALRYSFIVPVFNRPGELKELLESLATLPATLFEVVIVDDGSIQRSDAVANEYSHRFAVTYIYQPNTGPGGARNKGAEIAQGNWLIFLDSDVTVPPTYLEGLEQMAEPPPFFGGPDRAASDYTPIQKAISYSMTSFFTTGGIRGSRKSMEAYKPRSFNMGISRNLFKKLGGFRDLRFGEDIDLSLRAEKAGVRGALLEKAWVYHKRRSNFRQFFKQVFNSGVARIHLHLLHPGSMKLVHTMPAMFTIGVALLLAGVFFDARALLPLLLYGGIVLVDSASQNGVYAGLLSVPAAFVQLIGYGSGFLKACWEFFFLKKKPIFGFEKTFYT